jgi:hypothetical protein
LEENSVNMHGDEGDGVVASLTGQTQNNNEKCLQTKEIDFFG